MLEETGTPAESPLPPAILRGLGDRSYDKRKTAALDVTALIKSLQEAGERDCIANVVNLLAQEFTRSRNVHHRKGGEAVIRLIGLAACAIGLVPEIERFLHLLIPPVLECFDDPESRVCYYACESLYNISKVARSFVLKFFNFVFDGLCKLFAHPDIDVKNGANLLDRLVKDIVTESDTFDIEAFIPLLQKQIRRTKPYIRQLVVGWILVLNAVPDIRMLDYLPEFLDGLFQMLSDVNKEIQQAADNALQDFLREIKHAEVLEFGPMVSILVSQCNSLERSHRLAALKWVSEFIQLGKTRLVHFYSSILSSVMFNISDQDIDINNAAKSANLGLKSLVKGTTEDFELGPILLILTTELSSEHVTTRIASLLWVKMLHEKDPLEMNKSMLSILPALLKTLSDPADEVVLVNLQILASISLDKKQFLRVLNALVMLFLADRSLLETRGALVIRKLCVLLDSHSIYLSLADILNDFHHIEFAYDLSSKLILKFADVDVTVGFLLQIDKLVQLIESPIFIHLRLQLLEVSSRHHGDLLKSLYGLLMLLPQSQAYRTLSDRLVTVGSLQMHIGFAENRNRNNNNNFNNNNYNNNNYNYNNDNNNTNSSNNNNNNNSSNGNNNNRSNDSHFSPINPCEKSDSDGTNDDKQNNDNVSGMILQQNNSYELSNYYEELLCRFESVQEKHVKYRLSAIQQVKLRTSPGDGTSKTGSGSGVGVIGDGGGEQGPTGAGTGSSVLFTEDF